MHPGAARGAGRAGGIAAIRSEIIDDCALARRPEGQGPIWLGLTRRATSLRPYGGFRKIGGMIARSAYAQLGYSPLVPRWHDRGDGRGLSRAAVARAPPRRAGALAGPECLGVMALTFQPMLRFYRRSPLWGPDASRHRGRLCVFFTVQSAVDCWRGAAVVEGRAPGHGSDMTGAADFASGKGHRDENFPAIAPRCAELRPTILAFYRFARRRDDVADHETAGAEQDCAPARGTVGAGLRGDAGAKRSARSSAVGFAGEAFRPARTRPPEAFRRDVVQRRYADWSGAHGLLPFLRCTGRPVRARTCTAKSDLVAAQRRAVCGAAG